MTFANWTPPWDKWIVAMFSEWMSWMKNSDHRAPYPPLPTFQVSSIGSVADDRDGEMGVNDGKRVRDATLLSIFQFFTFAARI